MHYILITISFLINVCSSTIVMTRQSCGVYVTHIIIRKAMSCRKDHKSVECIWIEIPCHS